MYQEDYYGDGRPSETITESAKDNALEVLNAADQNKGACGDSVQPTFLLKHPLQNRWTLWYLENDDSKAWTELQNEIFTFDTVEDFWNVYNHFKPPSQLKVGCDYSLFKHGIRPMWEDPANKEGGRWVFSLNKSCGEELDSLWLNVLLFLIGESFVYSDDICGAVVNIRGRNNKISVWTTNSGNEKAVFEIGSKLKECLGLRRQNLQYQLHRDTMCKQGSHVKAAYIV